MSKYRRQINELLLKVRDGESEKMTDVFNLTYNHLKIVALYYLYDKNDFEDALSETYYRTLKYISTFSMFKDGYNWLCRIVQNVASDMNKFSKMYVLSDEMVTDDFLYENEVNRRLISDEMLCYIKTMPQIDRRLFFYRFYLELPYAEIAEKLNCTAPYIYKRTKRLIEKIAERYTAN